MKNRLLFVLFLCLFNSVSEAQEKKQPMSINTGFYMRWGPVFPIGNYSLGPTYYYYYDQYEYDTYFLPAKIGISAELGCHFYTGPSFAGNYLRVGIDATFLNLWFNPTDSKDLANWYWFLGQKAGPMITVSIPGGVMFDFGFKLSPVIGRGSDIWGRHFNEEVFMNFKFHQLQLSFQYGMGQMNYTNFTNRTNLIDIQTFRILLGMKIN